MLRSKEERNLERTFSRIETWDEFLKRWEEIDTEQEAIGLLYAGAAIPPFHDSLWTKEEEIENRVKFYLQVAGYKNNKNVAIIAEQVIVKQWLKQLGSPWLCGYHQEYLNANIMVLQFLQSPSESLRYEPYPRFVSKYLLPLYEAWHHGHAPDYQKGKEYLVLKPYTELIIRNLCVWGLSYVLASDGAAERIPIIKRFLDENEYDIHDVFMRLSGYGEPPNKLDDEVFRTAARAYLKLLYWCGDGITAKYVW